jgi:hypothetical protein
MSTPPRGIVFNKVNEPRPRRKRPIGLGGWLAVTLVLTVSAAIAALATTAVVWAIFWLIANFPTV